VGVYLGARERPGEKVDLFFRREMHVGQIWPSVPEKEPPLVKRGGVSLDQCHKVIQTDTFA